MSTVSSSIDLFSKTAESYTATAPISDGALDIANSKVTGDRTTGLFAQGANEMGKDAFLLLLVTQLQYQDPLNPMENTEFISQLAQFSALENSSNMEKAIGGLDESFKSTVEAQRYSAQSMNNTAAVALIGKEVRLKQTTVDWYARAGESVELDVHLGNNRSAVLEIVDKDGEVVKTMSVEDKDSENSVSLTWDGTTDLGTVAQSGTYTLHLAGEEENPELYVFVEDVVDGVRFSGEGALVKIAGRELSISQVLDVSGGSGAAGAAAITPSSAVSLLGKQVRTRRTSVQFNQADRERISFEINAGTRTYVSVELTDTKGTVVHSTTVTAGEDGIARFDWNGRTNDGTMIAPGSYRIRLAGEERDPSLYAFSEGIVSGIANLNGDARLRIGSETVALSNVVDIGEAEEAEEV